MILFHCIAPRGAASILETFGVDVEEAMQTLLWIERIQAWKGQIFKNVYKLLSLIPVFMVWCSCLFFFLTFIPLVMVFGSICELYEHHE